MFTTDEAIQLIPFLAMVIAYALGVIAGQQR